MNERIPVSWEDIAWSNMYSIEAVINILEAKGLITKKEVLKELKRIKIKQHKEIN